MIHLIWAGRCLSFLKKNNNLEGLVKLRDTNLTSWSDLLHEQRYLRSLGQAEHRGGTMAVSSGRMHQLNTDMVKSSHTCTNIPDNFA